MRKATFVLALIGIVLVGSMSANAGIWTFHPTPSDLYDLDHYKAYSWGIDLPEFQEVTEVTLTFYNIQDYTVQDDDILYVQLLDDAETGVTSYDDGATVGNYFEGQGVEVNTWFDPDDSSTPIDLSWTFSDDLLDDFRNYTSDNHFGLGFDPDCHYYNDGIELTVEGAVPEPTTISMMLVGLSMVGGGLYRRRKRK
ncbi:MAG: PEP-CTERM sorting domain-containing protein [candidate division Zixibacteria bacterium]|nr:PEP-CTERM sorting domain-containing protein [candidate division Zixibacteria bacterium]